ncbi:hypothetical protein MIND_01053300 [Mycena indigotica]|uniref:Iron-sulfur clusters transporter ATM1, mitochondrial n=1 Tax=Mycena indigotica TaxID=2126181 RepID=A0A8H6SA53_9AGAR|nr:uncharacterized protein MIND_01053300 [Mycena indigotica]KAF7295148.1 hypothetical protein MIND_01053300 [Mycena indigotica]
MLAFDEYARYGRQMILEGIGLEGQLKLQAASVVVVGAGGLGCPALQYLAAAGVGRIGIIDHDVVELSNLQRQILHDESKLGLAKAESASRALRQINSQTKLDVVCQALTPDNALELLTPYDVILDCTDNAPTRYLLSDSAVTLGKPLVSGAAQKYEGQLCIYNLGDNGPCYRCLFPSPPSPSLVNSCEETGILGAVTGLIGNLQALETIKLVVGLHDKTVHLLLFSALATPPFRTIKLRSRKPTCPACGTEAQKMGEIRSIDYVQFCGGPRPDWESLGLSRGEPNQRISALELRKTWDEHPNLTILDVRPSIEFGICALPGSINVPLRDLVANPRMHVSALADRDIYVICRLGNDSQIAAQSVREITQSIVVKDVVGGLRAWTRFVDPTFPESAESMWFCRLQPQKTLRFTPLLVPRTRFLQEPGRRALQHLSSPKKEIPSRLEQRQTDWKIVKSLVKHVWPKNDWQTKGTVVFGFGLLFSSKILNVQVPYIFKNVIDSLNLDVTATSTVWTVVGSLVLGYGAARIGSTVFSELLNAVFANIGQSAIRKVARETFEHLLSLDLRFHLSRQTGGLTRAIDRGTKGITFLLQAILFRIVPTALEISLVCGILTYKFGWDFAALTVTTLAAYTWFTIRTTSWRTRFRREANQADNKAASSAVDSLMNFEAVKHFNNESYEIAQYDKHLREYEQSSIKITTSLAFLNSGQAVIFSSALTGAMLMAAQGVANGTMSVGELVMINQLIFQLSLPLNFLGTIYREMRQNLLDMEVLFRIRDENSPLIDRPGARALDLTRGSIRFDHVNFSYHPDRPIFRNLSFTIPGGQKVAIVGPSGCGKSTILRLLFRFYEPESGKISIDDQDIRKVQIESLRRSIGVVPQETPLFHSDVMHNVRYGRLDATDEQVIEAARKANVHDTILRLPQGYSTKVGERGLMISGGEKQRLAVARVLLKDPPILFFDEATSALDAHTESELMRNINNILRDQGRTSIFIAHRLRTVVEADLIIVLKEGQVAEQGTHEQLLRKGGLYQSMWVEQALAEVDDNLN